MVGLPDGGHRVVCVVADSLAGAPAARRELPEAGAEVRAAEHHVEREAHESESERKVVEMHHDRAAVSR